MLGFEELEREFAAEDFKPNGLENFYYFFFEHGLTLRDIDELPIPYLWNIFMTGQYQAKLMKEQQEKNANR